MADNDTQGSFAFSCSFAEARLLEEAVSALNAIMVGYDPLPPSAAMSAIMPPAAPDSPWSGLVELMPDPEFPGINTDFDWEVTAHDPDVAHAVFSSTVDFEPMALAHLIQIFCQQALGVAPIGFEWASTCSRARIDEFGGGWCTVFADRIDIESTGRGLARALFGTREDGDTAISKGA